MTKLFLDDLRDPPDETWLVRRTAPEFIKLLREIGGSGQAGWDGIVLSLDHDLGACKLCREVFGEDIAECEHTGTGYDVLKYVEGFYHWAANQGDFIPDMTIYVHSQNPVARKKMTQAIESIYTIIAEHG
jgi:hypothetical protein